MKLNRAFWVVSLVLGGVLSTAAQPANVQVFQNNQQNQQFKIPPNGFTTSTNAPELYPGESTDVGPQRILRLNPRPDYFDVFFDSQLYYSDNANYAQGAGIIASSVWVNTVQAAVTPPEFTLGPGKFAPIAGVNSQWYNYGNSRMTSLDFNAQTIFINGRYTIDNWQIGLGGNYTRLLNQDDYDWTYDEWLPALTVQRFIPIGQKFLLVVGNQVDYHFTGVPKTPGTPTDINNRFDEAVNLSLNWQFLQQFTLQPYARFQYSNYRYNTLQTSDRNDYLYSIGVTLVGYCNKNFSVRVFFNYNIKQSDDSYTPAYHEYNGGLGGTLNFTF